MREIIEYTDTNGRVTFITNTTKKTYVNTGGINNDDFVKCFIKFMCQYADWTIDDKIIQSYHNPNYRPKNIYDRDISFMVKIYKMAYMAKQRNDKMSTVKIPYQSVIMI